MKINNMLLIVAAAGTLMACDKSTPDTANPGDGMSDDITEDPGVDQPGEIMEEEPMEDEIGDDLGDDMAEDEAMDEDVDAEEPTAEE